MQEQLHKMRANRKVIENTCSICKGGFQLAMEVYACPSCEGYHHPGCWDNTRQCSPLISASATDAATLEAALHSMPAAEVESAPPAPATAEQIMPDERRCPACRRVIKQQALKCRYCNYALDSNLAGQEIPQEIASQIESQANTSLICGIAGLFICAPILGSMAISRGRDSIKLLDNYPAYRAQTTAHGRARAGVILGWIAIVIFVLAICGRFSNI